MEADATNRFSPNLLWFLVLQSKRSGLPGGDSWSFVARSWRRYAHRPPTTTTLVEQFAVVYQFAIRRDDRTRYAAARVSNKGYIDAQQAKTESMDRIDNVVAAVHDIAAGPGRWV